MAIKKEIIDNLISAGYRDFCKPTLKEFMKEELKKAECQIDMEYIDKLFKLLITIEDL